MNILQGVDMYQGFKFRTGTHCTGRYIPYRYLSRYWYIPVLKPVLVSINFVPFKILVLLANFQDPGKIQWTRPKPYDTFLSFLFPFLVAFTFSFHDLAFALSLLVPPSLSHWLSPPSSTCTDFLFNFLSQSWSQWVSFGLHVSLCLSLCQSLLSLRLSLSPSLPLLGSPSQSLNHLKSLSLFLPHERTLTKQSGLC